MLARRFALVVLLPLLLLLGGAQLTISLLVAGQLREQQDKSLAAAAEALDVGISQRIAELRADLSVVGAMPEFQNWVQLTELDAHEKAREDLYDFEDRLVAVAALQQPRWRTLRLHAADGTRLLEVDEGSPRYRRRDAAQEAAVRDGRHPSTSVRDDRLVLTHALSGAERPVAVLVLEVLASDLVADLMTAVRAAAGGHVYLLGPQGDVLAGDGEGAPTGNLSALATTQAVLAGQRGVATAGAGATAMRVAYLPQADTRLGLVLEVPGDAVAAPIDRMLATAVPVALLGLLLAALLGFGMVRHVVRPIRQLTESAARVAEGDLSQWIGLDTHDELQELAESFNRMTAFLREARTRVEQRTAELKDAKAAADRRAEELAAALVHLEEAQQQLVQAEKMSAIGQLAGGIAHDFNNLLVGILGCADLLQLGAGSAEDRARYAGVIGQAARRAADLVQQLLSFSRAGSGERRVIDVHSLVREVVGVLQATIDPRIRIETVLAAEPASVRGDPSELQSALLNLGVNARDAMPEGGKLTFATEVRTLDAEACRRRSHPLSPGRYLALSVSDTGTGMDDTVRARLFEPFFTTKGPGKGTGLGLAAVYGMVGACQGAIAVQTAPGKGSRFELLLPLVDEAANAPRLPAPAAVPGRGTLLLVDDEPLVRNLAGEMLAGLGYEVILAGDGRQALRRWDERGGAIDLVILDVVMPGMGGAELLAELRRREPDVAVLLCSGHPLEDDVSQLRRAGASDFLQKPFTVAALSQAVAALLAQRPRVERTGGR